MKNKSSSGGGGGGGGQTVDSDEDDEQRGLVQDYDEDNLLNIEVSEMPSHDVFVLFSMRKDHRNIESDCVEGS